MKEFTIIVKINTRDGCERLGDESKRRLTNVLIKLKMVFILIHTLSDPIHCFHSNRETFYYRHFRLVFHICMNSIMDNLV